MKRRRKNPERPGDYGLRLQAEKMHRQAVIEVRKGGWHYGMPGPRGVIFVLSNEPRTELVICDDPKGSYAGRLRSFRRGTMKGPLEYQIVLNVNAGRIRPDIFPTATPLPDLYARFAAGFANDRPDFGALARIVDVMRNTFVHEATHLLDSQRTDHAGMRGSTLPDDPRARMIAYYNSPSELNAYYQAYASDAMHAWRQEIRRFIRGSDGMRRIGSLRKLARRFQNTFGPNANWFARDFLFRLQSHFGDEAYDNIHATHRARLRKRAAGLWETLRAMTRAEIVLRRQETA